MNTGVACCWLFCCAFNSLLVRAAVALTSFLVYFL